jgi:hypothetical protein
MLNDDQMLEARQRAKEFRGIAEEWCPQGGFLFGEMEHDE